MKRLPNSDTGFTLVELLIAVGIIAIMTSIAIPNYLNKIREQELKNGAQQILTDIRRANVKAQTSIEGTGWVVKVTGSTGTYSVYKCSDTVNAIFTDTLKPANLQFTSSQELYFQKNTGVLLAGSCSGANLGASVQIKVKNTKLTNTCTVINVSSSGTISYDETRSITSCT